MNPITKMRELLGPGGEHWCKSSWFTDEGKMCLSGAAQAAVYGDHLELVRSGPDNFHAKHDHCTAAEGRMLVGTQALIVKTANELFPEIRAQGYLAINDAASRNWQDIDLILKHAEAKWEEQEYAREEPLPCMW